MARRSKKFDDTVAFVMGLMVYGATSIAIGPWLNEQLGIFAKDSPFSFLLGFVSLLLLASVIVFSGKCISDYSAWRDTWAACSHGVRGGKYRHLCQQCIREQAAEAEQYKRQKKLEERRRRVAAAVAKLRDGERLRLAASIVPSLQELRNLSSQQFEDEMARMFERYGYAVEQTPYVNDHGRDAILRKDGHKFLLECKKYGEGNLAGRPELQKFHSAIITDRATKGIFVTTGGFTKGAIEFSASAPIDLIDGTKLVTYLFHSKATASHEDEYKSMCPQCEELVDHRLRAPQTVNCKKGHPVAPTLTIESVLGASGGTPICQRCGSSMRLIHWKKKRFWGCTEYPRCRYTRSWHQNG